MLFLNQTNPYLRIFNPTLGTFAEFKGGKLELDESDPNYEFVKAEALRNPHIVMLTEATQCSLCGEPFTGKAAAAQLGKHKKEVHFAEWVAEKQAQQEQVILKEVKARQPHACDLCPRVAEFGSADDLAAHVSAVHADRPSVDDRGNVVGAGPGEDQDTTEVPAAVEKG